jgi:hypothetical protein
MTRLRDYIGLLALCVGIALPVLSRIDQQRNLDSKVSDLAKAVLAAQAWQDSVERRIEIDAAVAAIRDSLRQGGYRREPTSSEVVGKLATRAAGPRATPPQDDSARQTRIKRYATK